MCARAGHVAAYACVRAQCKEIQESLNTETEANNK